MIQSKAVSPDPRAKTKKEYGSRLLSLRVNRKITQEYLAKKLSLSYQTISNAEGGRTIPQPINRKKIADFFGMDEWLIQKLGQHETDSRSDIKHDISEITKNCDVIQGPPGVTVYISPDISPEIRDLAIKYAVEMREKMRGKNGKSG